MSTKDLAAKYGKSRSSERNINAAIREELPGGNELLDVLETVHLAAGRDDPTALRIIGPLREARAKMEAEIRQRYGMPPREDG